MSNKRLFLTHFLAPLIGAFLLLGGTAFAQVGPSGAFQGTLTAGDCIIAANAFQGKDAGFGCPTTGTPLSPTRGGTGVSNGAGSTITLGGAFSTTGAFTTNLTATGNTSVTLPISGTLLSTTGLSPYFGAPAYVSTRVYLHGLPGTNGPTTTNATTLSANTLYAVTGWAFAPVTITAVSVETSTTNASSGAKIIPCVYGTDGAGNPTTLLGTKAADTAIGDSATSTVVSMTLDSAAVVPAGEFFIGILVNSAATQPQLAIKSNAQEVMYAGGATSAANLFGTNPVRGQSVSRTYASGCLSPFSGGANMTATGTTPAIVFTVQ